MDVKLKEDNRQLTLDPIQENKQEEEQLAQAGQQLTQIRNLQGDLVGDPPAAGDGPDPIQEDTLAATVGELHISKLKEEDKKDTSRVNEKADLKWVSASYREIAGDDREFIHFLDTLDRYLEFDVNALSEESEVEKEQVALLEVKQRIQDYLAKNKERTGEAYQFVHGLQRYFFLEMNGNLGMPVHGARQITVTKKDFKLARGQSYQNVEKVPLFAHEPSPGDIHQGYIGDCYFLAALATVVSKNPQTIKDCMRDNGNGTVTVRFYDDNQKLLYVTVDKVIPKFGRILKEGNKGSHNCLWVQMMERAYAASRLHMENAPDVKIGQKCEKEYNICNPQYQEIRRKLKDAKNDEDKKKAKQELKNLRRTYPYLFTADGTLTDRFQMHYDQIASGLSVDPLRHLLGTKNVTGMADGIAVKTNEKFLTDFDRDLFSSRIDWDSALGLEDEQLKAHLDSSDPEYRKYNSMYQVRNALYTMLVSKMEVEFNAEKQKLAEQHSKEDYDRIMNDILKSFRDKILGGGMNEVDKQMYREFIQRGWPATDKNGNPVDANLPQDVINNILETATWQISNYFRSQLLVRRSAMVFDPAANAYSEREEETFKQIQDALDSGKYVAGGTRQEEKAGGTGLNDENMNEAGIVFTHAYSILGVETREYGEADKKVTRKFVKVRNPWGTQEMEYYHKPGEDKLIRKAARENQGYFLVELSDFHDFFNHLDIVSAPPQNLGLTRDQQEEERRNLDETAGQNRMREKGQALVRMAQRENEIVDNRLLTIDNTAVSQGNPNAEAVESRHQRKKRQSREAKIQEAVRKTQAAGRDMRGRAANYSQGDMADLEKRLNAIKLAETTRLMIAEEYHKRQRDFGNNPSIELNEQYKGAITDADDEQVDADYAELVNSLGQTEEDIKVRKQYQNDIMERRTLRLRIESLTKQIQELDNYLLQAGLSEEISRRKEAAIVERGKLRHQRKVLGMKPGAERTREKKTMARHAKYDVFMGMNRNPSPVSREGVVVNHPETNHNLRNVGRATMGGTKPMYIFRDMNSPNAPNEYDEYLFKEAVNCLGFDKPEGALVTEAASNLQKYICGADASIPAFVVRSGDKVIGSMQKRVRLYEGNVDGVEKVDLYKWQASRQNNPDDNASPLPEDMKNAILREHVLDWLLCNFDTKGENFLQNQDGRLISFDKEASFSHIKEEGAQHMSYTYKPHSNDTIYNTIFRDYANNKIDLDLDSVLPYIEKVEALPDADFLRMFDDMLTQKYGDGSKREEFERVMLERKHNLRKEYEEFFGKLCKERMENIMNERGGVIDVAMGARIEHGRYTFPKPQSKNPQAGQNG